MRCRHQQQILLRQLITESTFCSPRRRMQQRWGGPPCNASVLSPHCQGRGGGGAGAMHACPPPGGGGSTSLLGVGVPPAPGVCWLARRARSRVCLGVCGPGAQIPFGCPQCPLLQRCRTPRCVRAHVGHGGLSCRSQTQDFVRRRLVSFLWAPPCAICGVKRGAACRLSLVACVCVCVCVICALRGGSLCSDGQDAPFGSCLLRPLWNV